MVWFMSLETPRAWKEGSRQGAGKVLAGCWQGAGRVVRVARSSESVFALSLPSVPSVWCL